MSLLTPERVPVKVYKWDDADAPQLDKSPNCVATIFKACLVTGYGNKEPAGWVMQFEDVDAGVKVLRPTANPRSNYLLRLSADSGSQVTAQIYLNMSDINTGELKLQCASPFKYAKGRTSGKWLLVASPIGFWFFSEQSITNNLSQSGAYFCISHALSESHLALYLQHTGGTNESGNYSPLTGIYFAGSEYVYGQLIDADGNVKSLMPFGVTDGVTVRTEKDALAEIYVSDGKTVYVLIGLCLSLNQTQNFYIRETLTSVGASSAISFGAAGWGVSLFAVLGTAWRY